MESQSVVIAEVEDFIKKFSGGELVLSSEARTMTWSTRIGKNFLGLQRKIKKSFPDAFGYTIANYQIDRELSPSLRLKSAYDLLDLIQRARAWGVIKNVKQQAFAYEQEIEKLKEQIANLKSLNEKLTVENKRLHNPVPEKRNNKNTQVGDVERS
jgi:hypothetical protein